MGQHRTHLPPPTITQLRRRLLAWYDRHKRDLPWRRRDSDAYAQMLAELMLQQTQVATVIPYFERFMARFPTVADLAAAKIDDVLTLWSGLGYYRRARHLHAAACCIMSDHDGIVPTDVDSLMHLPGIGRYTAGAIASIAYDTRAAVVDGNVTRVLLRLLAIRGDSKSPQLQRRLWSIAESLLPIRRCGDFNQALMELGATICRPQSPTCCECPLARICRARDEGLTDRIPAVKQRAKVQSAAFVVAAIRRGDQLLFIQRPATGLWAGLWELPSEPVSPDETPASARQRLRKRLPACHLKVTLAGTIARQLTHRHVIFYVYAGTLTAPAGNARSPSTVKSPAKPHTLRLPSDPAAPGRWLRPQDLTSVALSRAAQAVLRMLYWT